MCMLNTGEMVMNGTVSSNDATSHCIKYCDVTRIAEVNSNDATSHCIKYCDVTRITELIAMMQHLTALNIVMLQE